jgi:hypothetical protein
MKRILGGWVSAFETEAKESTKSREMSGCIGREVGRTALGKLSLEGKRSVEEKEAML